MRIISISVTPSSDKQPFFLRFQQGTGTFQNSYFLVGDNCIYQKVNQALNFALLGPESGVDFYESSLIIADDGGNSWELKRRKDRHAVLRNNEMQKISVEQYFQVITNNGQKSLPFSIGSYHFTRRDDQFYIAPLNHHNEEDQIVYKFINSHTSKILDACNHSFSDNTLGQQHILESLCENLDPIYTGYKETIKQLNSLSSKKETKPRDTAREIDELKRQVNLMQKVSDLTNEILDASPTLEKLRKQLKSGEAKIRENLKALKLSVIPNSALPPDWNVPLQCLCYLNVLEKVIPLLKQSLGQIQSHFDESIKIYKHDTEEFHEIRTQVLDKLKQCREIIHKKSSEENQQHTSSEEESSIWYQIKLITGKKQKADVFTNDLETILKSLDETIYTLHNINPSKQFPKISPKTLEEFLHQSVSKKETLKKHWQKICGEYQIDETISLHEFLQFILRYNELFIIMQKSKEIVSDIKARENKFGKLQELLYEWYKTIGSQKVINLDNPQIIISEAQNVVRYQKEKKTKLALTESNQLEIEVNLKIRNDLSMKLDNYEKDWESQFKKLKLKDTVAISDARIEPLFEKYRLLKSLSFLQNHITSLKIFPAFSKDWVYETFCVWRIPLINMDTSMVDRLINCLKSLPDSSKHILFFRDSELSASLRGAGLGQITAFAQQKTHLNDEFDEKLDIPPRPTPNLGHESKVNTKGPKKTNKSQGDLVSPRVKAVIDLLNGNKISG